MADKKKQEENYSEMKAKRLGEGPLDTLPRDIDENENLPKHRFRKIKELIDGRSNGN